MQIGSSPHTWRILELRQPLEMPIRIISTYVENTRTLSGLGKSSRDHLHIRGEYIRVLKPTGTLLGSSPHTWRIPANGIMSAGEGRIISTYVENTLKESYDSSILKRCNRPNTLLLPNFKALIFPH